MKNSRVWEHWWAIRVDVLKWTIRVYDIEVSNDTDKFLHINIDWKKFWPMNKLEKSCIDASFIYDESLWMENFNYTRRGYQIYDFSSGQMFDFYIYTMDYEIAKLFLKTYSDYLESLKYKFTDIQNITNSLLLWSI